MYHGIDWVYSTTESIFAYNFNVWYFNFFNSIFDDSFDFFFSSYWFFSLNLSSFQLFWSVILDSYIVNSLIQNYLTDEWFKSMLNSKEISLILINHPELILMQESISKDGYLNMFSEFILAIYELLDTESFLAPIVLLPQLLFITFACTILISFFFSYFTSSVKEENFIDSDYLITSASLESEKEIGSFDDIILALPIVIYIFGWYFYINCWSIACLMPEFVLTFYFFPCLYLIILGVPTFLVYDFGIVFISYLRGVGPSSTMFMEFIYDYIALIAFYVRILVQGVRLILMIFTYASLHDLMLYFNIDQKIFFSNESLWEELNSLSITLDSMSYFFLVSLPSRMIYWLYELFHTFFVVTAQFIAFFAMVFWLFLFLSTFFVLEQQEAYFKSKRVLKKNIYKDTLFFKNFKI